MENCSGVKNFAIWRHGPASAGKDATSFHVFLWSYMVVAFFILINVLLAILVDAFAGIKAQHQDAKGIDQELPQVAIHGLKRWLPSKTFALQAEVSTLSAEEFKDEVRRNILRRKAVLLPGGAPDVKPTFTPKARMVTPGNRLIKQTRQKRGTCASIGNPSVAKFTGKTRFANVRCPEVVRGSLELDGAPYGFDPSFMTFSSIYDGKLEPFSTEGGSYDDSERHNSTDRTPIGFFPHSYGRVGRKGRGGAKGEEDLVEELSDNFLLFFEERLSQKQAQAMLQYARDGGFIDDSTSDITLEMACS
ncbi:hypothetical protein T484DRAFT_1820591 [Baffinella frigidus]|nr:hypothetical protein T484DRAFT_1820591 [Cryptophyta sp. CCMP2293]